MKLTMISLLAFLILIGWMGKPADGNDIPSCQEDEIIQGTGNYAHGTWDTYVCAHDNR